MNIYYTLRVNNTLKMFICGEKIQNLCDIYIGHDCDFQYNPVICAQKSKHLHISNESEYSKIIGCERVFVYPHNLFSNFDTIKSIIGKNTVKFDLFCHNSDGSFELEFKSLLKLDNLRRIYTTNLCFGDCLDIRPIPIGLANSMWPHGNQLNLLNVDTVKTNLIYNNFTITSTKRISYLNLAIEKNIPVQPKLNHCDYIKHLASFKFAFCPQGNGIDTHRFWECEYLKTIPICERNYVNEYFGKYLPVLFVDTYKTMTDEELNQYYDRAKWFKLHWFEWDNYVKWIFSEPFDIVICHGPNDDDMLSKCIQINKSCIIGYDNLYVVTHNKDLSREDCIIKHESELPFSKSEVQKYVKADRVGWYLQQLIKLYSYQIVSHDHYLVVDCDTTFLKPTYFFENHTPLYNTSTENHIPYFIHMSKLNTSWGRMLNCSGITHHMMFNKKVLLDMMNIVKNDHNDTFLNVFLCNVDATEDSGASEYEIYFNFLLKYEYPHKIRQLNFANVGHEFVNHDYDYVSQHWYIK